ncbi:MAG: response regulator [Novosphingobium sp.]|jgi:DNA-binding NtrC family response regulator|nr:response regulator [Brevundimonas sp.]MCZ8322232.1 response regulator [Novosphingobium sp.]
MNPEEVMMQELPIILTKSDIYCNSKLPVIMFVDDDAEILAEYAELVSAFDILAETETSPEEAVIAAIDQSTIRIVVTDFRMAELDGLSMIQKVRAALQPGRDMTFILLTGDAEIPGVDPDLSVTLLRKPVDPAMLVAVVQRALATGA